ncbi:MAG TPA: hypothetical protein VK324_04525 [Tepidisphaeraceae bacterium]|nr:hypothetical protein [Tepidisphaeraceae bacterium]
MSESLFAVPQPRPAAAPGTCACLRCGRPCRVASETTASAHPIRKSLVPRGCCVDCAVTCFVVTGPLKEVMGGRWTSPEFDAATALRLPHVQAQFAAVFRAGNIAEVAGEIDWERVIANWALPVPEGWDWQGELYRTRPAGRRKGR